MLWVCGLVSTPAASWIALGEGTWVHIVLAVGPVAVALFGFCFLGLRGIMWVKCDGEMV